MCNLQNFLFCRTVEVNNTDAEGRLVLGDGVRPALIILTISHLSFDNSIRHSKARSWYRIDDTRSCRLDIHTLKAKLN